MRHFRHCSIPVLSLVLTASAVTAAGCSGSSSKAALEELDRVIVSSASKVGNRVQWLQTGESAAAPAADDLSRALTKARAALGNDAASQPEAAAQLQRGESLQKAIQDARTSFAATDSRAGLALEARQGVVVSATVRSLSDESTVAGKGQEILHDLICSAAVDAVAPEERSAIEGRPTTFSYLQDKSVEAVSKAVALWAAERVGAAFSRGFQWGRYGAELVKDASRHVKSIGSQFESPDLTVTRSYIYVVKSCLKPPAP